MNATNSHIVPDALENHSPGEKLVWIVLDQLGESTVAAIANETGLSESGVQRCLDELETSDLARSRWDLTQRRRKLWETTPRM